MVNDPLNAHHQHQHFFREKTLNLTLATIEFFLLIILLHTFSVLLVVVVAVATTAPVAAVVIVVGPLLAAAKHWYQHCCIIRGMTSCIVCSCVPRYLFVSV